MLVVGNKDIWFVCLFVCLLRDMQGFWVVLGLVTGLSEIN